MSIHKVLLYSLRDNEIDDYERLVRAAKLPIELIVCRSKEEVEKAIAEAEIVFGVHLPGELYKLAKKLKWIQSMWAGVENLLPSPVSPEVIITKPWGVFGQYISEYVFAYILANKIKMHEHAQAQAQVKWHRHPVEPIAGSCLAIAGVGDIGTDIARIGKSFGMKTIGLNSTGRPNQFIDKMFAPNKLIDFAKEADFLVLILPATKETSGMFNHDVFQNMKPSSILINVGRGALINDAALIEVLRHNKIAGAILDVFTQEPLPKEHPFWKLPNCIITPHIGGPSLPADITNCFINNFNRYIAGQQLLGLIDREKGY
jgi:glyoxylate/hydroxypyruvate reductase A